MIEIKNVSYSYQKEEVDGRVIENKVLDNISLTVKEGEFVAILGHNGSGKSTIAKHMNGILVPGEGECLVDGKNTKDEDKLLEIRSDVGMVFQNPDNQIVAAVVEDDVAFAPENLGVPSEEIRKRVDECLKTVGMYEFRRFQPSKLSGGQKQRIAIASVLAMEPKYIVLDEPTAMLDPQGRKEVVNTIRRINREKNVTVVLITHYMDEAAVADRVVVMDDGQILFDNTPFEVFKEIDTLKNIGLDVPQATELSYILRKKGFNIPHVITVEDCVKAITDVLNTDGGAAHD